MYRRARREVLALDAISLEVANANRRIARASDA